MTITDYINPDNWSVKIVEEDTSTGITYIGYSALLTDTSQPVWRIKRILKTTSWTIETTTITYARQWWVQLFNAVRDDRATYEY